VERLLPERQHFVELVTIDDNGTYLHRFDSVPRGIFVCASAPFSTLPTVFRRGDPPVPLSKPPPELAA
jgi:hypothetical protein